MATQFVKGTSGPSRSGVTGAPRRRRSAQFVATATAAVGLVVLTCPRQASATDYTITVDASKQTAGNPRFWAASVGTGTASLTLRSDLQTHYKIANRELGMMRVRGHGVLNDDMGIYQAPGSYDWTKFDTYLTAIVSAGMRPLVELSFMPTALAIGGDYHSSPKDYDAYKDFIRAVVQHCVDRFGADDVGKWYWEVWNEPDYPGFWNGVDAKQTPAQKMNDYYVLYDAAVDAATSVLPNILIGGPGLTYYGPIGDFLRHCKSANKRVTFVSSHCYPGGNGSSPVSAKSCVDDNNGRINQITGAGFTTAEVKSFNTEWNSSYSGQGGGTTDGLVSMDSHANAPFILKTVKLLSDKNVGDTPPLEVFAYWAVSDVFGEKGKDADSWILQNGGTLPFGSVFGLMTFQGVRKATFNAFKMLNHLGPKRLMSSGGTGGDGVDAMVTMSANSDELQILVYNYFAVINSSGMDLVTVNVANLPTELAGKELFVTHFRVDETHSNPFNTWKSQCKPRAPSEEQWQAMRQQQHLALLEPVTKVTVTSEYTTSFAIPRQAGSLIILGGRRPVTGRNGLVEIEGEDYDGQLGATKEDSNDTGIGQSIAGTSGSTLSFDNVDFSDAGVSSVQLRVVAQSDTTLELHANAQDGPLMGACKIAATAGAWATQDCTLTTTIGVHRLFAVFGGEMRLNWMKFQQASGGSGSGGAGVGGASGGGGGGTGGSAGGSMGGTPDGATGGGTGGVIGPDTGTGTGGVIGPGTGTGTGGIICSGADGSTSGTGASSNNGGKSGCGCDVGKAQVPSGTSLIVGLFATVFGLHRRLRPRPRPDQGCPTETPRPDQGCPSVMT